MAYRSSIFRAKNKTPEKWHVLKTTGKPLMFNRVAIACTTGQDIAELQVPQGERWVIFGINMRQCTVSSGTPNLTLVISAEDDTTLFQLMEQGTGSASSMNWPNNDDLAGSQACREIGGALVVFETQKVRMFWQANANKSGSGSWYIHALQFKVGDQ